MEIYKELTFSYAADADIKRENANIDADTSMGTMLKYGSEGAKYFVDNYILPRDVAAAHINGDIHFHGPWLPAGAGGHPELFRPGLHRHPGKSKRDARRTSHPQL